MSNFIQVTPIMHVDDLDRAVKFFTEILGFETQFRASKYAYVHRETAGFRMLERTGSDGGLEIDDSPTTLTSVTSIGCTLN